VINPVVTKFASITLLLLLLLTTSVKILLAIPTIDVKGSGFDASLQRLTCRFDTGVGAYIYSAGKIVSGNVQVRDTYNQNVWFRIFFNSIYLKCDVPSFDELPNADIADKVPQTAKVQGLFVDCCC
jgi:hypothetical protein